MNIYRVSFTCQCMKNADRIEYHLEIKTERMIFVEDLLEAISEYREKAAYHEPMADDLYKKLGGKQILIANHEGVEIDTRRG